MEMLDNNQHMNHHMNHNLEVEELSMNDANNHHHSNSMPEMMMMKMYFHFGFGDTLLFSGLVLDSNLKLILSCSVLFVLALLLEAMNYLRRIRCECELKPLIVRKDNNNEHDHEELTGNDDASGGGGGGGGRSCCQKEQSSQINGQRSSSSMKKATRPCCSSDLNGYSIEHCEYSLFRSENRYYKFIQAILYFFQTALSLTLMLAAMTYNICIIFSIVLGAGFGYYIFYRPIVDVEVCH